MGDEADYRIDRMSTLYAPVSMYTRDELWNMAFEMDSGDYDGDAIASHRAGQREARRHGRKFTGNTTRNGGTEMAKTQLQREQDRLEALIDQARTQAERVAKLAEQAEANPEPGEGMTVHFHATIGAGPYNPGREYEFAAVRVKNRWYHTGKSTALARLISNPCSWEELVELADSVSVAVDYASPADWQQAVDRKLDSPQSGTIMTQAADLIEKDATIKALQERENVLLRALAMVRTTLTNEATDKDVRPTKLSTKGAYKLAKTALEDWNEIVDRTPLTAEQQAHNAKLRELGVLPEED